MLQAPPDYKKMYILVNKSKLTLAQCAVQAGHSVAEFMGIFGQDENVNDWCFNDKHRTMIMLSATETQMEKMMSIFDDLGMKHQAFREPDLDNLLTSVAFEPVWNEQGKELFGKFNLI